MIYTLIVKDGESIEKILTLDCVNNFSKSMSGTVTKNPVENGFPISDHVSLENVRFDLSGIITSYSILDDDLELRWNGEYFETVGTPQDRLTLIEADIEDTFKKREVVTLVESETFISGDTTSVSQVKEVAIREYDNVIITNLTIESPNGASGAKFVRVSAEQVQVAFIEKAELSPEEQTPRLEGTKPKIAAGTSATTTKQADASETPAVKPTDEASVKSETDFNDSGNRNTVAGNQRERDNAQAATNKAREALVHMHQNPDEIIEVVPNRNGNTILERQRLQ